MISPTYVEARVSARLRLAKGAGSAAVSARARQALDRFLGGDDQSISSEEPLGTGSAQSPCPTRWPFGRWVFPSEVYAVLDRVGGIDAVSHLVLTGTSHGTPVAADSTGAIPISRVGLVYAGSHSLTVESDVGRRQ